MRAITRAVAALVALLAAGPAIAATRVVDDDGAATKANCDAATATPYSTITAALNDSGAGDKIIVCPGIYDEQLTITRAVTITGKGDATLRPSALAANSTSLASGNPIAAIVLVDAPITGVTTIEALTVDGGASLLSGCPGAATPNPVGIYYRNASGTVRNAAVKNMRLAPGFEGCQGGLGIFVQSDGVGGISNVTVSGTSVHDFQKNGITGNEPGTTLTATGNSVTGWGPTPFLAQNGIQIGFGAAGVVRDNRIVDHVWSPCSSASDPDCAAGSSSGILAYQVASGVTIATNTVATSQVGVYLEGNGGIISGNRVSNTLVYDGVAIVGDSNQASGNIITESDEAGIFILGNNNAATKNTINEAPVGAMISGTGNTVPVTGTTKNLLYNVGTAVSEFVAAEGLAGASARESVAAPAR